MRKLYFSLILFFFGSVLQAQTVLYQDDLETYPAGSYLAVENPAWWSTWSGLPGSGEDLQVMTTFSYSGLQSASIDTAGGSSDALLLLGDKFTGAYQLSWMMYIEPGKCSYYNIQHFEAPGTEYAMHVYFRADSTFEMTTGGVTFYGTYPQGSWFEIKHNIDLDANYISLYINGNFVHDWPFSYQIYYVTGTKQLGSVDFGAYAATGSGEDPQGYIDDILYQAVDPGLFPTIAIAPSSLSSTQLEGTVTQDQLTVNNTGLTDLAYNINILYETDAGADRPGNPSGNGATPKDKADADSSALLHYDGNHFISIGWSAPPVTVTVAARFPNQMTLPYAGMQLKSVQMYIDDLNAGANQFTVRIFGMGTAAQPGTILATQSFTPTGGNWDTVVLATPVTLTGEDLWVGYTFTQTDPGLFIAGVDAGPNIPDGDFLNTGGGWVHLSAWPGFSNNWNIRANLEGMPATQWLSAAPMADTIGPGAGTAVDATFDATSLVPGIYHATLKFISNDPEHLHTDIPVTLDVLGVGVGETTRTGIMVYPNPAQNELRIKSDRQILNVSVTDSQGRLYYEGKETVIDVSGLAEGIYLLRTTTSEGTSNIKFVKKR